MNINKISNSNQNFGYITRPASKRIRKGGYEETKLPRDIADLRRYFSIDKDYILDYEPDTSNFVLYSTDYYRTTHVPDYYVNPKTKEKTRDVPIKTLLNKLLDHLDNMKVLDHKGIDAPKRPQKLTFKDFKAGKR